jgi:tetratricopeptide (TPR) repeat protein
MLAGQPEKAAEQFQRALEIDPSWRDGYAELVWAYGMLGRYDDAREVMAPTGEWEPGAFSHFYEALVLSRVGRYDEARDHLSKLRDTVGEKDEWSLADGEVALRGELLASTVACERGDYSLALERAEGMLELLRGVPRKRGVVNFIVAAHLLAGAAQARSGDPAAARTHLEAQKAFDLDSDELRWWHGALAGEIALAEGDPAAAESAFAEAEPPIKMPLDRYVPGADLFRDGRARALEAQGELARAVETYRSLNTPDIANKWTALFEPRYVLEAGRLLDRMGRTEEAREQYERFLEYWKNADEGLPELEEARTYVSRVDADSRGQAGASARLG